MFGLIRTFYIKPHERGLLFYRSHFQGVLEPGTHRRMGWQWNVKTFDLNETRPTIDNLEFLLQTHADVMQRYFEVVRLAYNETALVKIGDQNWSVLGGNALEVFWRGLHDITVHRFNLDDGIEVPSEFVPPLRRFTWTLLKIVRVTEAQIGLLYEQGNFLRPVEPGDYAFWTVRGAVDVKLYNRNLPMPNFPNDDVLIEQHPEFVETYCELVQLTDQEVGIVRHRGKAIAILPPCARKLFWQGVAVEVVNLDTESKLSGRLAKELLKSLPEVTRLAQGQIFHAEVPAQFLGLFYENGAFQGTLEPGLHAWWSYGRSLRTEHVDLRLQVLDVAGQDILSKDKVPLRLNLTAGYRITDPVRAFSALRDVQGFLYKELQFGLRSAVGTKTLDELLEDKGAIDTTVFDYIRTKVADYGIEVQSVGVKDIILPGEMKTILASVVEAQKLAQANVIRRREETAATRSMLNTAKVMESNPVALRLKELEVLERIADKIERINVNGGLDSLLTEVIRIVRD